MAHRTVKLVKEPADEKLRAEDTKTAVEDGAAALRVVPLKLAPLLSPYRKHGRLSLRLERMPQLSRLSAGRNNGNGSWSLGGDELDDLTYMVPESAGEHTLAIRVISVDRNAGDTLAVLEYLVAADIAVPSLARDNTATAGTGANPAGDAFLHRLRDELALVKATLAARDAELTKVQQKAELAELALSKQKVDTELAGARADWKADLDERLAAAVSQSAVDIQKQREAWEAEQSARTAKLEERALERLLEARERWQKESEERFLSAKQSWKAEEATRFTAAQAEWQDKLTKARAEGGRGMASETELRGLHEKLASLKTKLTERDAALAEARSGLDEERERWQRQTKADLLKAEQAWKAKEAERLSAAEAQWRAELAEAQTDARRGQTNEAEITRLREKLGTLKATVAERDAALAEARSGLDEERERWQRQTKADLLKAEQAWKAKEAERLSAAEAQWRAELAEAQTDARRDQTNEAEITRLREKLGTLKATVAERDAALAEARTHLDEVSERLQNEEKSNLLKAEQAWKTKEAARLAAVNAQWQEQLAQAQAGAGRDQPENGELLRLRTELAELRSALLDRETALTHALAAVAEARKGGQGETQEAIAQAEQVWKAKEAERIGAIETQWRDYSEAALAEVGQRCEAAEEALAQLRLEVEAAQCDVDESVAPKGKIVLRTNSAWDKRDTERAAQAQRKAVPNLVRDVIMAAALGASAIFFYPQIEPYLPPGLRMSRPATTPSEPVASALTAQAEPAPPAEALAPAPPVAAPHMAVALQDANVRATPSTTAAIVARLRRGNAVALVESRGAWMLVQIDGGQGWVHASLLAEKDEAAVKSN